LFLADNLMERNTEDARLHVRTLCLLDGAPLVASRKLSSLVA
jgi:hypothetical protein